MGANGRLRYREAHRLMESGTGSSLLAVTEKGRAMRTELWAKAETAEGRATRRTRAKEAIVTVGCGWEEGE